MTDDTASNNVVGLRRVLRHKMAEQARGVVSSNPSTDDDVDWSKAPPWARAEARGAFETYMKPIKHDFDEKALQDRIAAAVTGIGTIQSTPNSPEAKAAFDSAPHVGPSADQLRAAIDRYERTPRDAFDVFLACADPETVYDFSSETKADGDRFVVTVTCTPRKP